jgi:hypothetical protein
MSKIFLNVFIILLANQLILINTINNITKLGPCTARLNDDSIISLSKILISILYVLSILISDFIASLDDPKNPMVSSIVSDTYLLNPCSSFKCGKVESAVIYILFIFLSIY